MVEEVTDKAETVDTDQACYEKAKAKGEPTFTLRAQDVTAPMLVRLWGDMQRWLEDQRVRGISMVESVTILEHRLAGVCEDVPFAGRHISEKVDTAYKRADQMEAWPTRKIAD